MDCPSLQSTVPENIVWFVLLEGALALALFVFIVWWTLPKKPKDGDRDRDDPE
jgi:hypothetical protein